MSEMCQILGCVNEATQGVREAVDVSEFVGWNHGYKTFAPGSAVACCDIHVNDALRQSAIGCDITGFVEEWNKKNQK